MNSGVSGGRISDSTPRRSFLSIPLLAVLRAVRWRLNRECCAELCSIPRRIGSGVIMGARFGSEGLRKDQKIKLRRYVGDRSP